MITKAIISDVLETLHKANMVSVPDLANIDILDHEEASEYDIELEEGELCLAFSDSEEYLRINEEPNPEALQIAILAWLNIVK